MKVKIISPETLLYEGEASLVQLPGIDGSFEILNNHAPIISVLAKGTIRLTNNKETQTFNIKSGVVESSKNNIQILVQ
jgi:F0F1-type ATP synthase, epsilon subunit (mitochondrial delta subunit)